MATAHDISHDEIRDLIAKGWTPPPEAVEPYRHLLRPFYDARGWKTLPGAQLDSDDCKTIGALIATFEHFGLEIPEAPKDAATPDEDPWLTRLRAYVAENDCFKMSAMIREIGLEAIEAGPAGHQAVARTLESWGFTASNFHDLSKPEPDILWSKRKAA
jgi:hypothetical protein